MASLGRLWPVVVAACGGGTPALQTADPGVVFTYPADQQLDVPLGSRIVVTFTDPVAESALGSCTATSGAFCLVGPNGVVEATPEVTGDGRSVQFPATTQLEPGVTYQLFVRRELLPSAANLPESGPLVEFTTRAQRPRSAAPALVAVNGAAPATPEAYRPMLETSTIRLVFSEPLDPRTVQLATGAIELVDGSGTAVPATVVAKGVHVSIDPIDDLAPGTPYSVRLGSQLLDLGGQAIAPATVMLTPQNINASAPINQVLRTRQDTDPGPSRSRAGADRNVIEMQKPLIGREVSTVLPGALAAELGDPAALGGPIAFTIRRGQRLSATGLDVKLGGEIPAGLSTGEIQIEFLTDSGGRIYRNPFQPDDQRPENDRAPLYVDLSMDVAVYTVDPIGNAVISQIALGVQATGTALATDGVLAIESVASMELGLLGVTAAPTNLVLELITDPEASVPSDTEPPALIAMSPGEGTQETTAGGGVELVFSEPVDLDKLRAGGIRLETSAGAPVPVVIESHGATVVLRPRALLPYSTTFRVVLDNVSDLAGNPFSRSPIAFSTPQFANTGVAMTVLAVHPGVPCALTGGTATSPGRCTGGEGGDDLYQAFTLAANEPVEIEFSQPIDRNTIALGTTCGTGNVRVEELDGGGACVRPVAGTVIRRERGLQFIPDTPWAMGTRYRFQLISGGDEDCDAGELCGITGDAASFDPLNGVDGGGGGNALTIDFTGGPTSNATYLFSAAGPFTDVNGDGFVNGVEVTRDENRGAMRIVSTTGDVTAASFNGPDCVPSTPDNENCIYLLGSMPTQLGELTTAGCPGGGSCVPVFLSPQAMFATSLSMTTTVDAPIIGDTDIDADTGITVMRVREPAGGGPVTGYIVDGGNGKPKMIVSLDLYMDAPDMSLPLSADHDLVSKPLSVALEGPVSFLADGRIVIALANTDDVPVTVNIDAPLGLGGAVNMILPAGEMRLQLVSRPLRGAEP